jgi:hypothetical protein
MKNKNIKNFFLDFGIQKSGKRKIYETLNGDLYDTYMLGRYFKDIFNLDRVIRRKIKIGNYSFIVLNLAENIDTNYCRISIL